MGIFSKINHLFEQNEAHHDLQEAYSEVHELGSKLLQLLASLRKIQKEIIKVGKKGGMGLQKTLFIEEELIPKFKQLAKTAEQRYFNAIEQEHRQQPISLLEREELSRILAFLGKLQTQLPDLHDLESKPLEEKLLLVETSLRNITDLAREFYLVEHYEKDLVRKVLQSELSPLLLRLYNKPTAISYKEQGKIKQLLVAKVTKGELRKIEIEAKEINAHQDPNFRVIWTHWWRDIQLPERDLNTPLKDPHINVTIKLNGPKKDVHLLLAA